MNSLPKVVGLSLCGCLLYTGLSSAGEVAGSQSPLGSQSNVQADEVGGARVQGKAIEGQLLRIEYGDYIVKDKVGKEVRLTTDEKTQFGGQVRKGDRVVAKVTDRNLVLSIYSIP